MKKIFKLAFVFMLTLALVGCGGSNEEVGKYSLSQVSSAGVEIEKDDELWDTFLEQLGGKDKEPYVELKDGNEFTMELGGQTVDGDYELDGSTIKLTIDGETVDGDYESGKIVIEESGAKMTFEK